MNTLQRLLAACVLLITLTACNETVTTTDQQSGYETPEAAVTAFLTDLNLALNEPQLADDVEVRRTWANRLAGHFAPRERADQRIVMAELLNDFVAAAAVPARGERVEMTITFTRAAVLSRTEQTAEVDVIDGLLVVRWRDGEENVVLERSANLLALIGRNEQGLPAVRVNDRWYLTEGF